MFADWGLDEQATTALVDVFLALLRHDYHGIDALREMLLQIEMNLDDDEFMNDEGAAP